jgi:hypothetical protein
LSAYQFFLENLNQILAGNKNFDDVVQDAKIELLELALETVKKLEQELVNILG